MPTTPADNRRVSPLYEGVRIAADAAKFVAAGVAETAMFATSGAAGAFAVASGRTPEEAAGVVEAVRSEAYQPSYSSDMARSLGQVAAPFAVSGAKGFEEMEARTKEYWSAKAMPLVGVAAVAGIRAGAGILDIVSPANISTLAAGRTKTKIVAGTSGVSQEQMKKFAEAELAGKDPIETASETGMWRGKDGVIRTWVDDRGSDLTIEKKVLQRGETLADLDGRYASLGEVLDHPELYKRYPGMETIAVRFNYIKKEDVGKVDYKAQYNPAYREMTINVFEGEDNMATLKSVLHEAQHDVQMIESMTGGSSVATEIGNYRRMGLDREYKALNQFYKEAIEGTDPAKVESAERLMASFAPEGRYYRNLGEKEAGVTEWAIHSGATPESAARLAAMRSMQEDTLIDKTGRTKRDFLEESPLLWGDETALRYVTKDEALVQEFLKREKQPLDLDAEIN